MVQSVLWHRTARVSAQPLSPWISTSVSLADAQCEVKEWYPGTVYYDTARLARETNAVVFGAARSVDRNVTPRLKRLGESDDFVTVGYYGYSQILSATHAPAYVTGCGTDGFVFVPYDLYAYSFGLGFRYEDFSAFYSASAAGGAFVLGAGDRLFYGMGTWLSGFAYGLAAPAFGAQDFAVKRPMEETTDPVAEEFNRIQLDYIAGAQYEHEYFRIRAGYVGSSGAYGHAAITGLRLFATSVLTNEFKDLSYLTAGLSSLHAFSEDLYEQVGRTALFVRKLQYESPRLSQPATWEAIGPGTHAVNLWTTHLEQTDIADYFDVQLAAALKPSTSLHIARAGVHTKNHHFEELLADDPDLVENIEEGIPSAGLTLGLVNVPRMPYYAEAGGTVFSATADLRATFTEYLLRLRYQYNDPDVLAMFPFAVGASALSLDLALTLR